MTARKVRSARNRQAHAATLGREPVDPLDGKPMPARPVLAPVPWNKISLSDAGRDAVALALREGYPRNEIAKALGTSVATLRRLIKDDDRLADAVEVRKDTEESELRDLLMGMARKGDTVAAIFLAKAQYGWRDRDDAKSKVPVGFQGGVLVVPGMMDEAAFEELAFKQQAPFRQRFVDEPTPLEMRTYTDLGDGMRMQRLLPGDVPH